MENIHKLPEMTSTDYRNKPAKAMQILKELGGLVVMNRGLPDYYVIKCDLADQLDYFQNDFKSILELTKKGVATTTEKEELIQRGLRMIAEAKNTLFPEKTMSTND